MQDFFAFLLALLTFDWLRRREAVNQSDADFRVMVAPRGECADCDDDVYLDLDDLKTFRHLSNRQVMRSTPHGKPHPARMYLPPEGSKEWEDSMTLDDLQDDAYFSPVSGQWRSSRN